MLLALQSLALHCTTTSTAQQHTALQCYALKYIALLCIAFIASKALQSSRSCFTLHCKAHYWHYIALPCNALHHTCLTLLALHCSALHSSAALRSSFTIHCIALHCYAMNHSMHLLTGAALQAKHHKKVIHCKALHCVGCAATQ